MTTYTEELTVAVKNRETWALRKLEEDSERMMGRRASDMAMDALGEDYDPMTEDRKSASTAAEPKKAVKAEQREKEEEEK